MIWQSLKRFYCKRESERENFHNLFEMEKNKSLCGEDKEKREKVLRGGDVNNKILSSAPTLGKENKSFIRFSPIKFCEHPFLLLKQNSIIITWIFFGC